MEKIEDNLLEKRKKINAIFVRSFIVTFLIYYFCIVLFMFINFCFKIELKDEGFFIKVKEFIRQEELRNLKFISSIFLIATFLYSVLFKLAAKRFNLVRKVVNHVFKFKLEKLTKSQMIKVSMFSLVVYYSLFLIIVYLFENIKIFKENSIILSILAFVVTIILYLLNFLINYNTMMEQKKIKEKK
ncbi:hypothetical protein [Candidatus Phytoplasma sacchari]|nr:hypothetical protein [Candidatus Phytoplasma sacchari]KAB8122705.1 hypothetical protein F2B49_00835 [Candidatus Phytoplasma sacchari]